MPSPLFIAAARAAAERRHRRVRARGRALSHFAVEIVPGIRPFVLAFSAASLLYIAMSDLIPDLHRGQVDANAIRQVVLIVAGIGTIVLFERLIG